MWSRDTFIYRIIFASSSCYHCGRFQFVRFWYRTFVNSCISNNDVEYPLLCDFPWQKAYPEPLPRQLTPYIFQGINTFDLPSTIANGFVQDIACMPLPKLFKDWMWSAWLTWRRPWKAVLTSSTSPAKWTASRTWRSLRSIYHSISNLTL